jgi:hypothetical protein
MLEHSLTQVELFDQLIRVCVSLQTIQRRKIESKHETERI